MNHNPTAFLAEPLRQWCVWPNKFNMLRVPKAATAIPPITLRIEVLEVFGEMSGWFFSNCHLLALTQPPNYEVVIHHGCPFTTQ